ncbi:general odorant-binding protein 19d-like [Tenebrio molitor]|uniref:general odorant-binding protein 19d-like n=1 Tax=Tenebrio molitor TaxID=7067 RepID=UPI0036248D52
MRFLIAASVLILGASAALPEEYTKKVLKKMEEVGTKCSDQEHATPDDMAELITHKFPPTSHEARCVLACFYKELHMMKEDGSFDKEATVKSFDEIKALDAELHGKILKVIDACEAKMQVFDDACESASSMATCVVTEMAAVGLTKEAFLGSS